MKKIITWGLSISIFMSMNVPILAASSNVQAREVQHEIIEDFDALCEEYNQNEDMAMEELLLLHPSLEIVDSSKTYFDDAGDVIIPTRSDMTDISLIGDKLVYDSDWDTYIYFGYWEWKQSPDERNLNPFDVVGFYTQNAEEMAPLEYFVSGYNALGNRIAYYNTDSDETSGCIIKGEDTEWGAAFWIDDRYVREGRMSVPIDYTSGSRAKVMLKYIHSWTTTNITGVGGSISIDGAGFDISWETSVNHWESPVTSSGVRLPK